MTNSPDASPTPAAITPGPRTRRSGWGSGNWATLNAGMLLMAAVATRFATFQAC